MSRINPKNAFMRDLLAKKSNAMRAASKGRRAAALKALRARPGPARRPFRPVLGMELKFLDESLSASALTAPTDASGGERDPAAGCIGCPAQGDGASNRDGRTYVIKAVIVDGVINIPNANAESTSPNLPCVFVALVQDTQTNGAQLNSEDVYTNPVGAALGNVSHFRNLSFSKRFIVHDSVKIMPPLMPAQTWDGTDTNRTGYSIPFKLAFNGAVKVVCSSTTANVNQVQDNSFHLIAYCTTTSAASAITYNARTRFVG